MYRFCLQLLYFCHHLIFQIFGSVNSQNLLTYSTYILCTLNPLPWPTLLLYLSNYRLAVEELLKDARRAKERADRVGPIGWYDAVEPLCNYKDTLGPGFFTE